MDAEAKRLQQTLLDAIAREASRAGSEASLARRAGLHPRFLTQARRRGRVQLDQALALIAALGLDPGRFVGQCLGQDGGVAWRVAASAPAVGPMVSPPTPDMIERALLRRDSQAPSTIPRQHLERLDHLRMRDPVGSKQAVEQALEFLDPADVPFALGVWATCCRLTLELDVADQALDAALDLARGDLLQEGELLLRKAFVVGEMGYFDRMTDLARDAGDLYSFEGDRLGFAKSLAARIALANRAAEFASSGVRQPIDEHLAQVSNGLLGRLDEPAPRALERNRLDWEQAIDLGYRALELLPDVAERAVDRFSILGCMVQILPKLERWDEARDRARDARAMPHEVPSYLRARLDWTVARGRLAQGRLEGLASALQGIAEVLAPVSPSSSSLATLDLTEVLLRRGEIERARGVAQGLNLRLEGVSGSGQGIFHPEALLDLDHLDRARVAVNGTLRARIGGPSGALRGGSHSPPNSDRVTPPNR